MTATIRTDCTVEGVGLGKRYGAVHALRDVCFHIGKGEIVGFAGDNGAGKSTLMKMIAGAHAPTHGTLWLNGERARDFSPGAFRGHGVEMVYQDLALCDNLDICENIFLGRERMRSILGVPKLRTREMREHAHSLLERLEISLPSLLEPVSALSGGQRQIVAISRAIAFDPKLVIMDEPTAALSVGAGQPLLRLIRRLPLQGCAVMLVSHRLSDLLETTNRIYVLRHGSICAEVRTAEATEEQLLRLMAGLDADSPTAGAPTTPAEGRT
jgi:ABC-type sugar transport system ATPase subunit